MEDLKSQKSINVTFGIYLGVISVLLSLIQYALGELLDPSTVFKIIPIVVMIGIIFLGIKNIKANNGGYLTFGEAIKSGITVALVSAVMILIYNQIFMNFVEPNFTEQLLAVQEQKFIEQGMAEEQIEMSIKIMKKFQGPLISSAFLIAISAFFGFVISAITGAIMKTPKTEE